MGEVIKGVEEENTYAIISSTGDVTRFVWKGKDIIHPREDGESEGGISVSTPIWGALPIEYSEIPREWVRKQTPKLSPAKNERYNDSVTFLGRNRPTVNYPWQLFYKLKIRFDHNFDYNFSLDISLDISRGEDGVSQHDAPLNPGFQSFFTKESGDKAQVDSKTVREFFREPVQIPTDSTIKINSGENEVVMRLLGDFNRLDSYLVCSEDNSNYFSLGPVLTHSSVFSNGEGMYLKEGGRLRLMCSLRPK